MTAFWIILSIICVVALVTSFFSGRNPIWGGLTIGIIVGLVAAFISLVGGKGFNWLLGLKMTIIITLLGAAIELLTKKKEANVH